MFPVELIINILAGAALLIYWVIVFVVLYHLSRFGIGTQPKKLAAIFLFGSVVLSGAAIVLFMTVDLGPILSQLEPQ